MYSSNNSFQYKYSKMQRSTKEKMAMSSGGECRTLMDFGKRGRISF
jgi:hypothetical protein